MTEPLDHLPFRLLDLAPELHCMIMEYLPPSSVLALQLTARDLGKRSGFTLASRPRSCYYRTASSCEKGAIRRYLQEAKMLRSGRRYCVVCRQPTTSKHFAAHAPICDSHEARFMDNAVPEVRVKNLSNRIYPEAVQRPKPVWLKVKRVYCSHMSCIFSWSPEKNACPCRCDSCGHFSVRGLLRMPGAVSLKFANEVKDRNHVKEEHAMPGESRISSSLSWLLTPFQYYSRMEVLKRVEQVCSSR